MREKLNKLYLHLCNFELQDGINEIGIPYIKIHKSLNGEIFFPYLSETFIYYVVSGGISVHDGDNINIFSDGDFYVPKSYSPISAIADKNFIAIIANFCMTDILSVLIEIDEKFKSINYIKFDNSLKKYSEKFTDILIRIFEYADNAFMLKNIKREFIYHIINSPYGKIFIENALDIQGSSEIFNINSWIKQNYKKCFSVEDLAFQANMGISTFHQKFKTVVGMGPIQCQKQLRLVEARHLMLDKSANVTSAALEVGYESISQFIADYRRMFGYPPQKDIQEIRKRLITKTSIKRLL